MIQKTTVVGMGALGLLFGNKIILEKGKDAVSFIMDEANYGGALEEGSEANKTLLAAMQEVIDLANKEGIHLTEEDLDEYVALIKALLPKGMPSMRQDAVSRRYSEAGIFSGTVMELVRKYNLEVPANQFLYNRIKEIEIGYKKGSGIFWNKK